MRKRIKKNPYIGQEDNGSYVYKDGSYSISYRIIKMPEGKLCIEWIAHKCHFGAFEKKTRRIKKGFLDFWFYQKWTLFFRPATLFILVASVFIFYFAVLETQEAKVERFKRIVASVVGIKTHDIQYVGGGWLEIPGQRRRIVEKINEPARYVYEPIKYAFNPLSWFLSSDTGFIKRWRSEASGGYVTHPVVYNDKGDVWLKKKNTWEHGNISGETIKWDTPQVSGLSIRKTTGQEVTVEDKKLKVIDK